MIDSTMREQLRHPAIVRWRTVLGIVGPEAIIDGESLTPDEQAELRRLVADVPDLLRETIEYGTPILAALAYAAAVPASSAAARTTGGA